MQKNVGYTSGLCFFSLVILFVFGITTSIEATTYYVSPTGDDGDSGLSGFPWATLQHAANTVQAGDSVLVADGTYAGFQIVTGGTASNPIVFKGNGNSVVVNSSNPGTADVINVEGGDYVVIENFVITGGGRTGIRVAVARGVIVKDNIIGPVPRWGIFTGFSPETQILNNICFDAAESHGIYLSNSYDSNDNCVVRGNESYGNAKNGIQLNGDCNEGGDGILSGNLIENNYVHDNHLKGLSLISITNSIIRNNVIIENGIDGAAGGIHLVDNPGCGLPSINNIVVNNTIVESRIAGIRTNLGASPNIIFNNLIIASTIDRAIVDEVGGNFIDANSNLKFTSTSGLFVNPSAGNFHLISGSPAIGAGIASYQGENAPTVDFDGLSRPQGGSYDSGAYEYVTGQVDTTPPNVSIVNPSDGEVVSGTITVEASATDNVAVGGVRFQVDGADIGGEDTSVPYQTTLNTALYTNGGHALTAVARDLSGNTTTSSVVSITVDNGSQQPPLPPLQVSISGTSPGCATVTWQAVGGIDVEGYMVYYGPLSVADGQATAYADSVDAGNSTSQEVCGLAPGTYYAAVKTYTTGGLYSAYSAEDNAVVTGLDVTAPTFSDLQPSDGSVLVPVNMGLVFVVSDTETGVDTNSVSITINGGPPDYIDFTTYPSGYMVFCQLADPFPPFTLIEVSVSASDLASPPNTGYITWSFTTGGNSPVIDETAPEYCCQNPTNGAQNVASDAAISIGVSDEGAGIDFSSVRFYVDGQITPFTIEGSNQNATIRSAEHPAFSPGSTVQVRLEVCDLASPPNCLVVDGYSFTVALQPVTSEPTHGEIAPDGFWANAPEKSLEIRNLPMNWTVRIFDIAGNRIREFINRSENGLTWAWDFANDGGKIVGRGLYLIRVTDENGEVIHSGRFLVQ